MPMITGEISAIPEAVVTLRLRGPHADTTDVRGIVDTGFTDYLTLPPALISDLELPLLDTVECQLADGRITYMRGFLATIVWHDHLREVVALAAEGEPLIGMSLLYGSFVTLEVLEGGRITIEPLMR